MLEQRFRQTADYGWEQLMRDLIDFAQELESENKLLKDEIEAIKARLDAGGL